MKDMEAKQNHHLKKVLKSYQLTAANTMSGPGPSSIVSRGESGFHRKSCDSATISQIHSSNSKNFITNTANSTTVRHNVPVLIRSVSNGGSNSTLTNGNLLSGNSHLVKRENLQKGGNRGQQQKVPVSVSIRLSALPPPPVLSEPDRSGSEKRETLLEGENLSCFSVGGEERLCFPEVITVLRNASRGAFLLPQINQVCDELQIFCSLCSSEQLEVLKLTKVLPMTAPSCGLIRKTDAERLVNSLLHQNPPKAALVLNIMTSPKRASSTSVISQFHLGKTNGQSASHFRVYHECFGTAEGVVMPQLYEKPDALCIECVDCHGLLSPARFVSHAHHHQENRTCHWGFDSANWRHYMLLSEDEVDRDHSEGALRNFKARFQNHKRKETVSTVSQKEDMQDQVVIKKVRYMDALSRANLSTSPTGLNDPLLHLPSKKRLTLFTQQQSIDAEKKVLSEMDLETVKKLVMDRMDKIGADIVNGVIDSLANKISSLERSCHCRTQTEVFKDSPPEPKQRFQPDGVETPAKANTIEIEIGSLKKQLLRRHEQLEVI